MHRDSLALPHITSQVRLKLLSQLRLHEEAAELATALWQSSPSDEEKAQILCSMEAAAKDGEGGNWEAIEEDEASRRCLIALAKEGDEEALRLQLQKHRDNNPALARHAAALLVTLICSSSLAASARNERLHSLIPELRRCGMLAEAALVMERATVDLEDLEGLMAEWNEVSAKGCPPGLPPIKAVMPPRRAAPVAAPLIQLGGAKKSPLARKGQRNKDAAASGGGFGLSVGGNSGGFGLTLGGSGASKRGKSKKRNGAPLPRPRHPLQPVACCR